MSSNELQALLAGLKPRSSQEHEQTPAWQYPQGSRANSGLFSPAIPSSPPPPFSSNASAASRGNDAPDGQRNTVQNTGANGTATDLLRLLNFGRNAEAQRSTSTGPSAAPNATEQSTSIPANPERMSASDLIAQFGPGAGGFSRQTPARGGGGEAEMSPNIAASQDALLKLLNKQHLNGDAGPSKPLPPPQAEAKTEALPKPHNDVTPAEPPAKLFGILSRESTPAVASQPEPIAQPAKPLFTYTNPFEALHASRGQTPKASTPLPRAVTPQVKIEEEQVETFDSLKDDNRAREVTPEVAEQVARRKKLTPKGRLSSRGNSVPLGGQPENGEAVESNDVSANEVSEAAVESDQAIVASIEQPEVPRDEVAVESPPAHDAKVNEEVKDDMDAKEELKDDGDVWEDAEDEPKQAGDVRKVPVYNFPIKPFVGITLELGDSSDVSIRTDGVMEISRLKKDFDQLDRTLAAATTKYITYVLVKSGMRIIRQDDGADRQVFKHAHDRIFNLAFCTTATVAPPSADQAVIGTGVSGAVYYATVSKEGNDLFENNDLDSESLIFPPWPPSDENTAGGVLKTRAKRSSRHPEFFAVGRGKSINIIWPATAMSPRYGINENNRRVDVEKFYDERSLQVVTGKAGKDFTFSEDDSLIVSLDKTGRLRFWDVRKLVDESNATAPRSSPIIVDTPLLSLSTSTLAERSWPTSVMFVDKARPYTRGGPLRYVLVGLRQNHTLQLWDIALGKAVQELSFPHENETDGICSVNYHPSSGIIVVGHQKRNSLFFIHLSAPRYTLSPTLTQATFIQRVAAKDPEIPRPESTACMSGIREISFGGRGDLRSVDILPIHQPKDAPKVIDEKTPLFELYVVHSKGVTCLNVNKEDLGWNAENKVLYPIDANKEGLVTLRDLKIGIVEEAHATESPPQETEPSTKSSRKKSSKKGGVSDESKVEEDVQPIAPVTEAPKPIVETVPAPAQAPAPTSKESKKSKKKSASATPGPSADTSVAPIEALPAPSQEPATQPEMAKKLATPIAPPPADEQIQAAPSASRSIPSDTFDKEINKIERAISAELKKELQSLYQSITNDRAIQDSTASARQEAVLRLVSSSLSNNVERTLSKMLSAQVQEVVVPAITTITVETVTKQVGAAVTTSLAELTPQHFNTHLPSALNAALQNPALVRTITDAVSQKVSKNVDHQLSEIMQKTITPAFESLAIAAAEKATTDVEQRLSLQIQNLEQDRESSNMKIDKLSRVLQGMADTLQAMSDTQVAFQSHILRDRRQGPLQGESSNFGTPRQVSTARHSASPTPIARPQPIKPKTQEELELDDITMLMNHGKYEEGSIKWLQSQDQVSLFDNLFVRFTPEYLATDTSPLIAFSVAVTVGTSLATNTARRLDWILAALGAVDTRDPEITDLAQHAPALLSSLVQKLESLYMSMSEQNPRDPALRVIPQAVKRARDIKTALVEGTRRSHSQIGMGYGAPLQTL